MPTRRAGPKHIAKRLGALRFDIVICADAESLEFLVGNRSTLFPAVPIVFCNIEDFSLAMLKGETDITGVTSELDFEGTIELARMHPDMRHLVVLANRRLAAQSPAYARLLEVVRYRELASAGCRSSTGKTRSSRISSRGPARPPDTVVLDMASSPRMPVPRWACCPAPAEPPRRLACRSIPAGSRCWTTASSGE